MPRPEWYKGENMIIPALVHTLEQKGMDPQNITILIATGMHQPNLGKELENLQQTVDELLGTHPETMVVPERPYVVGRIG